MNSTKAIYWIALGVFALAMSSEYQNGRFQVMHQVADRAEMAFCQFATHAERTLALARVLTGKEQGLHLDDQFARQQAEVEAAVAEHQAEIARAMALRQADVDRVLADHQAELSRAMSLRQEDLDRVQQKLDRMRVVLDHAQLKKVRVLTQNAIRLSNAANRRMVVVCPTTGKKISVNVDADASDIDQDAADLEVGDSF